MIPAVSLKRVRFRRQGLLKEPFYRAISLSNADCGLQNLQVATAHLKDYPEEVDLCSTPERLCPARLDPDFGRTLCEYMPA